jgi:hypothetical protein
MNLKELLDNLEKVRKDIKASPVFLCGGAIRDKYIDENLKIEDIDLCNGDSTIHSLASEFSLFLKKQYNIKTVTMKDNHTSIYIGDLKLDFSSNFIIPNISKYVETKTNIQKEIFSRDFTCNSLLLSIDLKTVYDLTHNGFNDIKNKKIKTCLDPKITLTVNKNRVIRAIYLACKLGFEIDNSIIEFVKNNPETVNISSKKTLVEKLNNSFETDADKAVYYINKMNLWNFIPITSIMIPYYKKNIKKASIEFFKKNLDYNEIDFPVDDQINSGPILGESSSYSESAQIGGRTDTGFFYPDSEGIGQENLTHGVNSLENNKEKNVSRNDSLDDLEKILDEVLNSSEPDLLGLQDGILHKEDLDQPLDGIKNPFYGVVDSGNTSYDRISY